MSDLKSKMKEAIEARKLHRVSKKTREHIVDKLDIN